jgi:hypothetical protein
MPNASDTALRIPGIPQEIHDCPCR